VKKIINVLARIDWYLVSLGMADDEALAGLCQFASVPFYTLSKCRLYNGSIEDPGSSLARSLSSQKQPDK
jgi:hypothetical protein